MIFISKYNAMDLWKSDAEILESVESGERKLYTD